jgi:hypothetical protein
MDDSESSTSFSVSQVRHFPRSSLLEQNDDGLVFTTILPSQSYVDPYAHISNNRVQLVDHLLLWNDQEVIDYGDESAPAIACNQHLELGELSSCGSYLKLLRNGDILCDRTKSTPHYNGS